MHVVATDADLGVVAEEEKGRLPADAVTVSYFQPDRWASNLGVREIRRFLISSAMARALRQRIGRFDIVHIHYVLHYPNWIAARICQQLNVPYIVSPLGQLDPYMGSKSRFLKDWHFRLFGRAILDGAEAVHLLSESERQMIAPLHLNAPQVVMDFGVDTNRYQARKKGAFRSLHPAIGSRKLVVYVGRLSYTKGLDLLADGFGRLAREDSNLHLVLIGPDTEGYGRSLRSKFPLAVLREQVTFAGRVSDDDKVAALVDADLFVFPSYSEAFGLAMLEAMACGVPVLLTETVGLSRELAAAGAAFVVGSDPGMLAAAMAQLLADDSLRQRLAAAGRRLTLERFNWPIVASRFLDFYETALKGPPLQALSSRN